MMKFFIIVVELFVVVAGEADAALFAELPSSGPSLPEILHEESTGFCNRDLSTLKQLIVVFRHGDSTPDGTFATDTHQEDSWPTGFAQLTQRGIERAYELGRFMRSCYGSFLAKIPSPRRLYARSSDSDQTIMSAQAVLAGSYPPSVASQVGQQAWGETAPFPLGQHWQPFTVHTVDDFTDNLLMGHVNCPRYEELVREVDFDEKTTEILFKDLDFLKMLSRKACFTSSDLLSSANALQKAVLVQIENGRIPVPWLADERIIEKLAYYRDIVVDLHSNHPEMAKITAGSLLQEIINRLVLRSVGNTTLEHILYSGHDLVIEGLLGSLGVLKSLNNRKPPYGAAVIFELHRSLESPNSFTVMTFYRNSSVGDPIPLEIPGCDAFEKVGCSIEDFKKALAFKTSRSHDTECMTRRTTPPSSTTSATMLDTTSNSNDVATRCLNAKKFHYQFNTSTSKRQAKHFKGDKAELKIIY